MEHGKLFPHGRAGVLDDETRLTMLSEEQLRRLLDLRGSEDIVDLGSGTGFYTNRVAAWTTGTVYAVELQAEMQRRHREKGLPVNVRLVLADVNELPLPAGSVDRALSINTFHETHGRPGLERLARALRPGGRLVVVDWRRAEEAADRGPSLEHRLTSEEVGAILAPWFAVAATEVVSPYFFAVVAVLNPPALG